MNQNLAGIYCTAKRQRRSYVMSFNLTLFNNLDPHHQGLLHKKQTNKKNPNRTKKSVTQTQNMVKQKYCKLDASSFKAVPTFWERHLIEYLKLVKH